MKTFFFLKYSISRFLCPEYTYTLLSISHYEPWLEILNGQGGAEVYLTSAYEDCPDTQMCLCLHTTHK